MLKPSSAAKSSKYNAAQSTSNVGRTRSPSASSTRYRSDYTWKGQPIILRSPDFRTGTVKPTHLTNTIRSLTDDMRACGIYDPMRQAAFVAIADDQVGKNLRPISEYDANAMGFRPDLPTATDYALKLGNTSVAEGWLWRGRNLIQITGHDNYGAAITQLLLHYDDYLNTDPQMRKDLILIESNYIGRTIAFKTVCDAASRGDEAAILKLNNASSLIDRVFNASGKKAIMICDAYYRSRTLTREGIKNSDPLALFVSTGYANKNTLTTPSGKKARGLPLIISNWLSIHSTFYQNQVS